MFDTKTVGGSLLATVASSALVVPLATPAAAAEIELQAPMHSTTAFTNAHGHAEYESDLGREFDIEIAGVPRLSGHRVIVRVHGDRVGSMRVGRFGRAELERHGVFRMRAGDIVRVRTVGGTLVIRGTLRHVID